MESNNNLIQAKQLKIQYLKAINNKDIPLAVTFKQEFYSKGYNELLNLDEKVGAEDEQR